MPTSRTNRILYTGIRAGIDGSLAGYYAGTEEENTKLWREAAMTVLIQRRDAGDPQASELLTGLSAPSAGWPAQLVGVGYFMWSMQTNGHFDDALWGAVQAAGLEPRPRDIGVVANGINTLRSTTLRRGQQF